MTQRAMLCPRCRRLIGSDETTCSWCGFSRSGAWWKVFSLTRGLRDGDWLVRAIVAVNIVFYILSLVLSSRVGSSGLFSILSPDQTSLLLLGATGTIPVERLGRVWSLLAANYLHGGVLHILFNMMAFRQIAPLVNQEYSPSRMFIIYTLGGIFGFAVSVLAGVPFTIGASAAVCGLIGALLYFGKSRGGTYGAAVFREVSGWVVGLALFGLVMPGINNWGHGGGIVGGVLLGMVLGYDDRRQEAGIHRVGAILCAVVTIGVLGWAVLSALLWFGS